MKIFVALFLLAIASAVAHPIPPIAGTYSNLTYLEGEGDVTGIEITIIPSGAEGNYSYFALIQIAEGVTSAPELVPVKFDGTNIIIPFTYPGAGPVKFAGKLAGTTLIGDLTGAQFASTAYSLPRKLGFWQPVSKK